MQSQATSNIMMIRPVHFGFNPETAESNAFQDEAFEDVSSKQTQKKALEEFDEMVDRLQLAGVNVVVYEDTADTFTPDSIFPNNWVSFHASGKVVLYPMEAENRRRERRMDIINDLRKNYSVDVIFDFSHFEEEGLYLEGTGSLVLDRSNRIAYACLSSRTSMEVLLAWQKQMNGYELVIFHASDQSNIPVYHTNVLMSVGDSFCIICLESIKDYEERMNVRQHLEATNKHIIEISFEQMGKFAGNALLVKKQAGGQLLVMSDAAYYSLSDSQISELEEYAEIIHFDLSMIEACGGGSARCMMAEIHLPMR